MPHTSCHVYCVPFNCIIISQIPIPCSNRVDIRTSNRWKKWQKVHSSVLARSCKFFLSTLRRCNVLNTVYHLDERWFISIWENHDSLDEFPLYRSVTSTLAQNRSREIIKYVPRNESYVNARWRFIADHHAQLKNEFVEVVKSQTGFCVLGSEFWEWDSSQTESLDQIVTPFNGIDVVANCERAKRKPKTVNRRSRHVMHVWNRN